MRREPRDERRLRRGARARRRERGHVRVGRGARIAVRLVVRARAPSCAHMPSLRQRRRGACAPLAPRSAVPPGASISASAQRPTTSPSVDVFAAARRSATAPSRVRRPRRLRRTRRAVHATSTAPRIRVERCPGSIAPPPGPRRPSRSTVARWPSARSTSSHQAAEGRVFRRRDPRLRQRHGRLHVKAPAGGRRRRRRTTRTGSSPSTASATLCTFAPGGRCTVQSSCLRPLRVRAGRRACRAASGA